MCLPVQPARAQWSSAGVPVATGSGWQGPVQGCSDGAGGVLSASEDFRNSRTVADVYAQRLDASGQPATADVTGARRPRPGRCGSSPIRRAGGRTSPSR